LLPFAAADQSVTPFPQTLTIPSAVTTGLWAQTPVLQLH